MDIIHMHRHIDESALSLCDEVSRRGNHVYIPFGVSIGRLSGVGALWNCVPRVCGGGGGCASGGVPLGAGPCCPGVGRCLGGKHHHRWRR